MVTSKLEFDCAASKFSARMVASGFMVSNDAVDAANEVEAFIGSLPKMLINCHHCKKEIQSLRIMKNNVLLKQ